MSILLFITAIVLNGIGIVFSGTYLWVNTFSRVSDLAARNKEMRKMTWFCILLTTLFTLLSCLLSNVSGVESAIARAEFLYAMMAISWLVVVALCGIALLYAFVSRGAFKRELTKAVRKLFWMAMVGLVVGMVFVWVL